MEPKYQYSLAVVPSVHNADILSFQMTCRTYSQNTQRKNYLNLKYYEIMSKVDLNGMFPDPGFELF